jgi:hypothetical protein
MTRVLTAVVGITMVAGLAACSDDTLFNDKPPYPSSSYGSSGAGQVTGQPTPNGTATPSAQPAPGAGPTRGTAPRS